MSTPQVQFVPAAVAEPASTGVVRRRRSTRRTSTIDVRPVALDGSVTGFAVRGVARDLFTDEHGLAHVLDAASLHADLGFDRSLLALRTEPADGRLDTLIGASVLRGFRAAMDDATGRGTDTDPLSALLDGLPVAVLVGGFTEVFVKPRPFPASAIRTDICAGWVQGGLLVTKIEADGVVPVTLGPPAPELDADDPDAWHELASMLPTEFRRRRVVDVVRDEGWTVRTMFRDTYIDPTGDTPVERVLHEYELEARLDDAFVVRECSARAHVLPWPECPAAAASATRVVGRPARTLTSEARQELVGVSTCTHLTDLVGTIPWALHLAPALAEAGWTSSSDQT